MERKNTILLTVIAVATLLVAVVGATFAYFTATGNVNSQSVVNVTTSTIDSVYGGATNCTMNVTGADMSEADGTEAGVPKTNTDCTLQIIATKDGANATPTTCTYDITYTPGGNDTVGRSVANTANKKEFSLEGAAALSTPANGSMTTSSYAETDLYTLQSKTTIVNDATFTFTGTTNLTWTWTLRFYNYNFNQNELADKKFGGTLAIENIICSAASNN
jgi:predicted ribosomally synthesized peptide with SipW-like signal peptide